jgi:hypothetical protein
LSEIRNGKNLMMKRIIWILSLSSSLFSQKIQINRERQEPHLIKLETLLQRCLKQTTKRQTTNPTNEMKKEMKRAD